MNDPFSLTEPACETAGQADASGPAACDSLLGYAPRSPACLAGSRGTSEGRAGRPIGWSVLFLSALLLPSLSAAATRRQAKAIETYQSALRMRAALEGRPPYARPVSQYLKLIRRFQEVYRIDPSYRGSPAALADAAKLYQQVGRQFSDQRYFDASI